MAALGGVREVEGSQNSLEIDNLARFALDEHNKKEVYFSSSACSISLTFELIFVLHLFVSRAIRGEELDFENALLEFVRVINAKQQVVAGSLYHITLEATNGGKKKVYEARVLEKPWLNFKEVQEFKLVGDAPSVSST